MAVAIGSVGFLSGSVQAVSADGEVRSLVLGEAVMSDDTLRVGDNSRIEIRLINGDLAVVTESGDWLASQVADGSGVGALASQGAEAAIGVVTVLVGQAIAVAADGSERQLQVGDVVYADEVVRTSLDGRIEIALTGSDQLVVLEGGQSWLVSSDVYTPADQFDSSEALAGVDAIQAAILAGEDPTAVAEATAAGATAAGSESSGNEGADFIIQARTAAEVDPTAGYGTRGFSTGVLRPESESLLPETIPTVSVSVEVDTETPTDPNDPNVPDEPNADYPVIVSGNTVRLLEGSSTVEGDYKIVTFNLVLSKPFSKDVTITYQLNNGTATYGEDWLDGDDPNHIYTVVIPAGQTTIPVTVKIIQDRLVEGDETVGIVLLSAENAAINPAASSGVIVIYNDDTAPVAVHDVAELPIANLSISGNVLSNDTDEDGDAEAGLLSVLLPEGQSSIQIEHQYGTLIILQDGSYTFTLNEAGESARAAFGAGDTFSLVFENAYQVTDGVNPGTFADVTINIEVVNDAPTGELGAMTNFDSDVISLDISSAFSDLDGDTLTFSATGLPPGLSISPTGVISGTIAANASDATDDNNNTQDYSVVVTVDDGNGGVINVPFVWTVNNTIPEFLSGSDTADTLPNADSYVFSAPEGTAQNTVVGTVTALDKDGDALTYSITGGNAAGLFAINPNTGEISVTQAIDDAQLGHYELSVRVDDNEGGFDIATVTINLTNENDDPVGELGPRSSFDSDVISLDISSAFSDADGDSLIFSATGLPPGLSISPTGVISGTIAANASDATDDDNNTQDYSVVVTVDDGNGGVINVPFVWTVNNTIPEFLSGSDTANTPPNADSYVFSAPEGTSQNTVVGTVTALDKDGDALTYSITGGNQAGLFAIDPATGAIRVTQAVDDAQVGEYTLTVKVDDNEGGTDTASVTISLTNVNDNPQILSTGVARVSEEGLAGAIPDATGNIDTTNAVIGGGKVVATDADGDSLSFSLSVPATALTSGGQPITWSGNGTGEKGLTGATQLTGATATATILIVSIGTDGTWTAQLLGPVDHADPNSEDNLTFTVGVTVSDGNGGADSALLSITVEDDSPAFRLVNDGPDADNVVSIAAPNPATNTVYEGQFADWSLGADGFGAINLTLPSNVQLVSKSANQVVLNLTENGEVVGILTLNANGLDTLEVMHRDGEVSFIPVAATSAKAGGPVGSLLVNLGTAATFNVLVTGDDGDGVREVTSGNDDDLVNTSNNGWAVKGGNGQTNQFGESIQFAFVSDTDINTAVGIADFKFRTEGYTGGISTARIIVRVYTNESLTTYDEISLTVSSGQVITITDQDWSGVVSTGSYVPGDDIFAVQIISAETKGSFRINGIEVGDDEVTPPNDLAFENIGIQIVDADGDTASQSFSVYLDGEDPYGGQLVLETTLGTSGSDTLLATLASDILTGGEGDDLFVWTKATLGGVDRVTDFNFTTENDVLDLSDVLSDGANSIGAAVNGGHLQLRIHETGNPGNVLQVIEVENVAVANQGAADALLSNLLASNNIDDGIS